MAFSTFFSNLWDNIKQSPTFVPTYIEFSPEQTDDREAQNFEKIDSKRHYFMVSINEMFLSKKREWHREFSPMVFSACSFLYDGQIKEIPYVIGPSYLKEYEQRVPNGMLYLNTPVIGVHPWKGGNVSLSIILSKVQESNNVEKLLKVVENVSNSLDFSTGISNYLKIGKVVLDGFESLLGFEETTPLLGINNNFGQAAGNNLRPKYYALIHGKNLDKDKFWVKNNRLCYGDTLESATIYQEEEMAHDFILFKIGISTRRYDEEALSFNKTYNAIYDYIGEQSQLDEKLEENLKTRRVALSIDIRTSPDLTHDQAKLIWKEKNEMIEELLEEISLMGDGEDIVEAPLDPINEIMNEAIKDINR